MADSNWRHVLPRLRQRAYTGENRCLPCTAVNLFAAILLSAPISFISPLWGSVVFCTFVLIIYFRGYLLPKTPTLTRRYLPEPVLELFGKGATSPDASNLQSEGDSISVLFEADVLEPCTDIDDFCLSSEVRAAWSSQIHTLRGDDSQFQEELTVLVGTTTEAASVIETDEGTVVNVDGEWIGVWPSRSALLADVAAARTLRSRWNGWRELSSDVKEAALSALRPFLLSCPGCSGEIHETVETRSVSCCRVREVAVLQCEKCGDKLLEIDVESTETTD